MGAGAGGKMGDTNEYTVHDLVRDELYKNMDVEYGKFTKRVFSLENRALYKPKMYEK